MSVSNEIAATIIIMVTDVFRTVIQELFYNDRFLWILINRSRYIALEDYIL